MNIILMSKGKYLDIKTIKKYARELRRHVTNSEKDLWEQLRTGEYDQFRDEEMMLLGLQVLRIKNEELSDMQYTLEKISKFLISIP